MICLVMLHTVDNSTFLSICSGTTCMCMLYNSALLVKHEVLGDVMLGDCVLPLFIKKMLLIFNLLAA